MDRAGIAALARMLTLQTMRKGGAGGDLAFAAGLPGGSQARRCGTAPRDRMYSGLRNARPCKQTAPAASLRALTSVQVNVDGLRGLGHFVVTR